MSHREQRVGELYIGAEVILYSFFPTLIHYASGIFPPIFLAAASTLIAAACLFIYGIITGKNFFKINKAAKDAIYGITLFIVIIPSLCIFIGTTLTSGINTALLLQAETLFTFFICGLFFKEKMTTAKVTGASIILCGTIAVLYNGGFSLNLGDVLIILGTASYPFGNIYGKKALRQTDPVTILFLRSVIGGGILFVMSLFVEKVWPETMTALATDWWVLLFSGVVIYCFSKLLWYEGLKRIEITHAIGISTAMPAISFLFAVGFLKETPTLYQVLGLFLTIIGLLILTWKSHRTVIDNGHCA